MGKVQWATVGISLIALILVFTYPLNRRPPFRSDRQVKQSDEKAPDEASTQGLVSENTASIPDATLSVLKSETHPEIVPEIVEQQSVIKFTSRIIKKSGNNATAQQQTDAPEPPTIEAPMEREALRLVGIDPGAEQVWLMAINDPTVPEDMRKDLIEDLNEEGFPDPKNLTPDDAPLILSRLELIEQIAPEAMDEVNDAAFMEAYKDLINMLNTIALQ